MLRSRVAELEKATTVTAAAVAEPSTTTVALAPVPASAAATGPLPGPAVVMAAAPASFTEPLPAERPRMHTYLVQKGDTLQSLALRYYGTRSAWEKIYQANRSGLPSKDQLKVGQQLVIP